MRIAAGTAPTTDRSSYASLAAIVAAGVGIRLLLLAWTREGWVDPDHYMQNGWELATGSGPWLDRVVRAAAYPFAGQTFYLPPLYPVFLSLLAALPAFPLNAAIAHCIVGGASAVGVFVIGERLHSRRAGLIAAAVFAAWPPGINSARVFMQEQLYVPLLVASFALLAAWFDDDRRSRHFLTGICFGLAALTRMMILYYVVALPLLLAVGGWPLHRLRRGLPALLLGTALVVVPYSVVLSLQTGQAMLIENHGGFDMVRYADGRVDEAPTLTTGLRVLADAILSRPGEFVREWWDYVRTLLKPFGTRWIEAFGPFASRRTAVAASAVRLVVDGLYLAVLGLAPIGVVLARRRRLGLVLAAWVVLVAAATAATAAAGARYRTPADPFLIALAAVAVCQRPVRLRGLTAAAAAVGACLVVVVTAGVPSVSSTPAYGFESWKGAQVGGSSSRVGDVGFALPPRTVGVRLALPKNTSAASPAHLRVFLDGVLIADLDSVQAAGPHHFAVSRPGYLRVLATDARTGQPVKFDVEVVR